ncbi:MAG: hypothetical protein J0I44_03085 [Microbacterium sp.]|nr:hypothetical protein [Microbacterium sp.]
MKRLGLLVGALIVVAGVASGTGAQAATGDDGTGGSTAQQRQAQAVAAWEGTAGNMTRDTRSASKASAATVAAASSGGTHTMRLYRGSWLMWAQESVQYGYSGDGRTVNWSSAWQDSGWVFPNSVKEGGTQRFYKSSTLHSWRGKYTVGAGVPTPWGNANVYSASSNARSDIKNIGSIQWWQN